MSADKKAAPAAPRFQERLKTQITRSTVILLTAFLLLFGGLLAIYSEGYTHYENRVYNQQLTESFGEIYRSCAEYLRDTDNTAVMRSFLDGQISEQSMSYQFHRFSYASLRVSDLLLLDSSGNAAFSTLDESSMHLLYFCQSTLPRLTESMKVYTTIYYMTARDARLLFATRLDDDGYAFLLLDGNAWNLSLGQLPYDFVITNASGTAMVASNGAAVSPFNQFVGGRKAQHHLRRSTVYGQRRTAHSGRPAGLYPAAVAQLGHLLRHRLPVRRAHVRCAFHHPAPRVRRDRQPQLPLGGNAAR